MRKIVSRLRAAIGAAAIVAFSVTMATPTPALAWWGHPGWGWHAGWHYHWHGCCWGPRVVVGVAPPVAAAPPAVVYAPPPVPSHWNGAYWVP